jgi:saccharopine dehydrogenase-like NADP-dependent oxidoreductase
VVLDLDAGKAEAAARGCARARGESVVLEDSEAVDRHVRNADLVVSLLPYTLHVPLARVAIARRKPMVTTSYVSAEMAALDAAAREAGVLVLNEAGLDPGLDHMSAMRVIDGVRAAGGRVAGFRSCCGGIPTPEANTNPWGYKFSWSPRGVLLAGRNAARWLEDGRIVDVPGPELFTRSAPYAVAGLPPLEVYPNRDSLAYVATYGIEGVQTMFRGTLRWPGWCATLDAVARLGLLDVARRTWRSGTTCAEFLGALLDGGTGPLRERVAARLGLAAADPVVERLAWAGLFSQGPIGVTEGSAIDVLCGLLEARMVYAPGESDMVALQHEFRIVTAGGRSDTLVTTLVARGEPGGDSAMSRTVSLPAAVAARLLLDGRITLTGVRVPVHREIYEPILDALEPMGIRFE